MLCYIHVGAGAAPSGKTQNKHLAVLMYAGVTASRRRRKSRRIDVRRHYDIPMMVQCGRQDSTMDVNADTLTPCKWDISGGCGIP